MHSADTSVSTSIREGLQCAPFRDPFGGREVSEIARLNASDVQTTVIRSQGCETMRLYLALARATPTRIDERTRRACQGERSAASTCFNFPPSFVRISSPRIRARTWQASSNAEGKGGGGELTYCHAARHTCRGHHRSGQKRSQRTFRVRLGLAASAPHQPSYSLGAV